MAERVKLQQSYSKLNESLTKLFDESGVRRSFTVPYVQDQPMADHIAAVSQAASQTGGMTKTLITTSHHSDGKGWGSSDGHTTGFNSDQLRTTVIPKDDENAKSAIDAAQKHLDNISKLLGDDDPAVNTAKSQLSLVKKTDGAGMNLLDFGVMMTQIMYRPNQAVARAHSGTKEGGHAPQLRAPGAPAAPEEGEEQPGAAPEQAEGGEGGSEAQPEGSAAPSAPETAGTPAPAAPETAQG